MGGGFGGGDVGFVKCSFVTADRAIPSKGLCTHTTLVKRVQLLSSIC